MSGVTVRPIVVAAAVALVAAATGCMSGKSEDEAARPRDRPAHVRIRVPGHPFRVAAGEGYVWVLNRAPRPCTAARPCTVSRIDPRSNRVVGRPTRLPADGWELAVGFGSAWATQFDGSLIRIDARTGVIDARISARPIYFGSVVTVGGGFVWTGNDDERNESGSVSKIDPDTNRVVGTVTGLRSPQSISFGGGAVWVADHAGWLVKVDPTTLDVVARRRLDFGAHGVVATEDAVFVADAHANRLLEADPKTAEVRRIVDLPVGLIYPTVGAGLLWSSSAAAWSDSRDDRVIAVDPETLKIVQTLRFGGNVPAVAFGFGSVWAPVRAGWVVRASAIRQAEAA
jgi:DNA-binding beta-propeller fold protein YncE